MAEVRAFRAWRYDLGRAGPLSDLIAPPYDVIDADLQQALYERSPYNVVRLILNKEEPGDDETHNRYTRAARFLRDWQQQGILIQDSARSLYVYHQEFTWEGRNYLRRGFLACVRLEPLGRGQIYPHEETLPGPKADRLQLLRAVGMNLSPVFGLYPDTEGQVQALLDAAIARTLPLEAVDHLGVHHRLWTVSAQHLVSEVVGLMGPRPIFLADGHHRYETALRYREERQAAGEARDPEAPVHFILMMLVSLSDPGLLILPTHRLLSGLPALPAPQWRQLLEPHFHCEEVGQGEAGLRAAWELLDEEQDWLAFASVADQRWQVAHFETPQVMAELAPEHSPAWRRLAVAVLHQLVLGRLLPQRWGQTPTCQYVHTLAEVADALRQGRCQAAVLVPPVRREDVAQIAGNREKMPPKSTYFFPKVYSGLVFHSLKKNSVRS